ncbi:MAG TPA: hypothetical protein VG821_01875 [Rhizomicrobium sp.]|nr:hypothetical protein [Rhizomicrobium sp.]
MTPGEIFVEFVVMGNTLKATAIDPDSGLEASVIGPANAPQAAMADAARRKLNYLRNKKTP